MLIEGEVSMMYLTVKQQHEPPPLVEAVVSYFYRYLFPELSFYLTLPS
jgi:hypothetical protein